MKGRRLFRFFRSRRKSVRHYIEKGLRPGVFYRWQGNNVKELIDNNGLSEKTSRKELGELTREDIRSHQELSDRDFSYGVTESYSGLKKDVIDNNPQRGRSICIFHANAVSLNLLKLDLDLVEPSGYDDEKEYLVFEGVPTSNFLAVVKPEDTAKFFAGMRVENSIASINKDVPKSLSKEDIEKPEDIFGWLLENDCDNKATDLAQFMYKDKDVKWVLSQFEKENKKELGERVIELVNTENLLNETRQP